jgi:hypothetical protein
MPLLCLLCPSVIRSDIYRSWPLQLHIPGTRRPPVVQSIWNVGLVRPKQEPRHHARSRSCYPYPYVDPEIRKGPENCTKPRVHAVLISWPLNSTLVCAWARPECSGHLLDVEQEAVCEIEVPIRCVEVELWELHSLHHGSLGWPGRNGLLRCFLALRTPLRL